PAVTTLSLHDALPIYLNLKGIVQGRGIDSPLNETGKKQAEAFYAHYRDVAFDKIYTSTLLRTHQTVAPFAGLPSEQLGGLDEIRSEEHTSELQSREKL